MSTFAFSFGRVEGSWFERFPPTDSFTRCWVVRIPGLVALCYTRWV